MNLSSIVAELARIRNENGLSRRYVARGAGVRMQIVGHWEKGNIVPSPESLSKWANALGYELVMDLVLKNSDTGKGD